MSFPFTITYTSNLRTSVTDANRAQALECIRVTLSNKSAKNLVIGADEVSFRGTTSPWRGSLMGSVDKGTFKLIEKDGTSVLTYKFYFIQLFIVAPIIGVFFGVFSKSGWVGLGAFLWLGGMNWVIALVRHHGLLEDVAGRLNTDILADEGYHDLI